MVFLPYLLNKFLRVGGEGGTLLLTLQLSGQNSAAAAFPFFFFFFPMP